MIFSARGKGRVAQPLARGILAFAILAVGSACGARETGAFGAAGFYHRYHPIFIPYEVPELRALLGEDWIVTNFQRHDGVPDGMKTGQGYVKAYAFETANGDRESSGKVTRNDLVLEHRRHDGVIWLRSEATSQTDADKSPSVMLRRWLAQMPDKKVEISAPAPGPHGSLVLRESGGLVPDPLQVVPCRLADRPAAMATFSVADPEVAAVDPAARRSRVTVVMARTGYRWGFKRHEWPAWLVVGYENLAPDFDRGAPAFRRLLDSLHLGRADEEPNETGAGFRSGLRCKGLDRSVPARHREPAARASGADSQASEPPAGQGPESTADATPEAGTPAAMEGATPAAPTAPDPSRVPSVPSGP